MYNIKFLYLCCVYHKWREKMKQITIKVDEPTLQAFDGLCQVEGWESRQEALVFLMRQAVSRGYISKEKYEVLKGVKQE